MNWKKGLIVFMSLYVLLAPLALEAKVNLTNMNRLENVEIESAADDLVIKFRFKKPLVHLRDPIFLTNQFRLIFLWHIHSRLNSF